MGNLIAKIIAGLIVASIIYGISKWDYDQCTRVKDAMKDRVWRSATRRHRTEAS